MEGLRSGGHVLVTGATGPHGGAVAHALLRAGHTVRVLTRDPGGARARQLAAAGAEPVAGDLTNQDSLVSAMTGAGAVYAVTTPFGDGARAETRQGEQLIAAARATAVPWFILASVASADRQTGVPHFESKWQIEQELRSSGVPHTVIAPTYFFENLGALADVLATGSLALPLDPNRPLQQVALTDLGALVVAVLGRHDEFLGERVEVAGDQPTPDQMAAAVSAAYGEPVHYRRIPLDQVGARSADLAAMYGFLQETGYHVDIGALKARFPELRWTSFAAWARGQSA